MEHLDLAGVITTPTTWILPEFEQQDAIFLSSSRQMLEPILEETSEDEEHAQNSWNQYENSTSFWSSAESETGSVIRIEVNKDPDSISERDFACPAKRARRSEEFLIGGPTSQPQNPQVPSILDDAVLLRRSQRVIDYNDTNSTSLERFLAYEACSRDSLGSQQRGSTGSRRFDEFYSDSDSLSYHSLSRSSSLIQFESLERQLLLQEQHASMTSLGNSSPSLLSIDSAGVAATTEDGQRSGANSGSNSGNNSRRGSQSSLLKRFESSDGRLHQTYFDLDKLNFDDEQNVLFGGTSKVDILDAATIGEIKSDSESSTSSGSSSGNSVLTASKPSAEDLTDSRTTRITAFQRGGKNSAENLSEDSGYCEPSTLRRTKSKSIPKNFEKFCEEEEFHQYEYDGEIERHVGCEDETDDRLNVSQNITHSNNSTIIRCGSELDICQPKINDATFVVESSEASIFNEPATASAPSSPLPATAGKTTTILYYDGVKNSPTRETTTTMTALEHIRSLAHSPSPVSSVDSTGSSGSRSTRSSTSTSSASTCASAASFTWLPIQLQQPPQRKPTLCEFSSPQRNSLPDIRDALSSEEAYFAYNSPSEIIKLNGYVLEHSKVAAAAGATDDISTSSGSSSSAHDSSRSDATDAESTPETKKRTVVGGSGGGGGGSGGIAGYVNRTRISSVPNELNRLGRKKRANKLKYSKSSTEEESTSNSSGAEEADDFFDDSWLNIRRSCSWSERRERNLQKFEGAIREHRAAEPQSVGYMNASYQNLTLLDYSDDKSSKNRTFYKRCSAENMADQRKNTGDYEGIICKGNFLLDELSEIYDRNASILTDKPLTETESEMPQLVKEPLKLVVEVRPDTSPKVPPRQRKHSNSNYSDLDGNDANEIQHVQLTIRKPPARQKAGRNSEATNSLVTETTPTFGTFGKTFDQDPTNLRTSYAQSLEKCNFDPNEVSNSDIAKVHALPKRRFQTHSAAAKKRNLVSSTPNLNAFDPRAEEIEDDIYVTSAHTSMHQLPQGASQKPLGILLPAGSRTSFSKEVSFCPVVSKYCWQEQSSEECNEPQLQRQNEHEEEEETDDELLDNADATVIYNTKENEMVAARYKEEHVGEREETKEEQNAREQVREMMIEKEQIREVPIAKENANNERENDGIMDEPKERKTSHEVAAQKQTTKLVSNESPVEVPIHEPVAVDVSLKATIVQAATTATVNVRDGNTEPESNKNTNSATTTAKQHGQTQPRPLSIQLPILSEPPTNRAHNILYASQQMLDNLQRREYEENNKVTTTKSQSVSSLNTVQKNGMYHYTDQDAAGGSVAQPKSNNNNTMKSKFKADEKHPSSKGFLSRFANGFRFSLRRNKKKQLQQQKEQQQQQQQQLAEQTQSSPSMLASSNGKFDKCSPKSDKSTKSNGQPKSGSRAVNSTTSSSSTATSNGTTQSQRESSGASFEVSNASTASVDSGALQIGAKPAGMHVPQTSTLKVTGKPPLPKLPPRTLTAPTQAAVANQSAGPHAQYPQPGMSATTAANFTAPASSSSSSQFYVDFLDMERSYYDDFQNQLNSGMQADGTAAAVGATNGTPMVPLEAFTSPSRASVSQKTQMFNNLGGGGGHGRVAPVAPQNLNKIGLIETNLDTHETVISGKTRSLMDIGPQQQQASGFKYRGKRLTAAGLAGDDDDDDLAYGARECDDDDDDDEDGGSVVVKSTQQAGGGQIASVRRPHKSMEFLLDKENQKNVLPPENELQKSHEHNPATLSEHQLRVQASLQRLNIPDWYRQYNQTTSRSPDGANSGISAYKPGNFTRKRTTESGRWAGLNSKTTSLSSLGSQRSDRSPLLLSPSAHSHHGGQSAAVVGSHHQHQHHTGGGGTGAYGTGGPGAFSRWSTSHLNSSQTSPSVSQRGSFSRGGPVNSSFMSVASGASSGGAIRNSFRQPYLGWRSQEKLSQRTPHERLASSLLAQQQRTSPTQRTANGGIDKLQPVTPEIQTSIKEVTSAIVHYVNDQTNQQRSRSTSPNSRKCWLESSFVGIRPLDSPQTPVIDSTATTFSAAAVATAANNNNNINYNRNSNSSAAYLNNSSATSSIHSNILTTGAAINADVLRMNGLSLSTVGGESAILI